MRSASVKVAYGFSCATVQNGRRGCEQASTNFKSRNRSGNGKAQRYAFQSLSETSQCLINAVTGKVKSWYATCPVRRTYQALATCDQANQVRGLRLVCRRFAQNSPDCEPS